MSFVIAAGGTGGHITPALAVAAELQHLGKKVVFAGSLGGMEEHAVREAGLEYQGFAAKGFDRQKPWTLLSSSLLLARSTSKARKWLKEIDAEAVAAFGGYVSVPVGRAAVREGVALLVHEQNSAMGWANKYLSRHAEVIALTYAGAAEDLSTKDRERVQITGNPIRQEFAALADDERALSLGHGFRDELGISDAELLLLVFGGSQGARHINQAVVSHARELMERPDLTVVHVTGPKEFDSVERTLAEELNGCTERWHLLDYCNQMPAAFAAADIVVSRAGASSLAELSMAAKPALLIPYPYATADHQRKNAESLVKAGAATMVLDADLDSPHFLEALLSLIDNPELHQTMWEAARKLTKTNATARVAELLIGIAR